LKKSLLHISNKMNNIFKACLLVSHTRGCYVVGKNRRRDIQRGEPKIGMTSSYIAGFVSWPFDLLIPKKYESNILEWYEEKFGPIRK